MVVFKLTVGTAIHDITFTRPLHSGNWQKSSFTLQNQQKVCQCGHNKYPVPSYEGSSLRYGGENACCMYWACANEFHALLTLGAHRHNVSPILKFGNKLPVW